MIAPQGTSVLANYPEGKKFPPHVLTEEEYAHVLSGTGDIVALGQVVYDDIFGSQRNTYFQFVAVIPSDPSVPNLPLVPADEGNLAD